MSVNATAIDATIAIAYDNASGGRNAPTSPLRTTMGSKPTRITTVANASGRRVSSAA
jgi:hypothetical protein